MQERKLYHTMIKKRHLLTFASRMDDLFSTYNLNYWLLNHTLRRGTHVVLRRSFVTDLMEVVVAFSGEEVAKSVLHKWDFEEMRKVWLCILK